jgi:NADH-quinone oxidoreductase subunit L
MRITFLTFAVGTMALAGVPFLFSGFWSKEAILHAAENWEVSHIPLVIALVAVAFTAFYMTRLVMETFFGKGPRETHLAEHPPKENSAVMTTPLVILMVCAIGLGFLGTPAWPWLQRSLDGGELHADFAHLFEGGLLMFLSIALVGAGISVGWWIYGRKTRATAGALDPLAAAQPGIFNALSARLGFDELYAATVFRLNAFLGNFADWADRWVWGGAIRSVTALSQFFAFTNRQVDEELINDGFDHSSEGLRGTGINYSRSQDGGAHGYLRTVAAAFALIALIILFGGSR